MLVTVTSSAASSEAPSRPPAATTAASFGFARSPFAENSRRPAISAAANSTVSASDTQFCTGARNSGATAIPNPKTSASSPDSTRFRIQAARLRRRRVTDRKSEKAPEANPAVSRYGVKNSAMLCRRMSLPNDTHTALRKLMNVTVRRYQMPNAAPRCDHGPRGRSSSGLKRCLP